MDRTAFTAMGLLALAASSCLASVSYTNDFQEGAGPEWSARHIDDAPLAGQRILGQFSNDEVVLTLASARAGELVRLAFDFCAIRTWDGEAGGGGPGPDTFSVEIINGPKLLQSTFSVGDPESRHRMSYAPEGTGLVTSRYGAIANNSLGYGWADGVLDATWRLSFSFLVPEDGLAIRFSASGLQNIEDESWGLDNVQVESVVIPSPGTLVLAGAGLAFIGQRKRAQAA